MIKINLLPVKKAPFWQGRRLFMLGTWVFIVCLGGVWIYHLHQEWQLAKDLQQTRLQHELLKPTQALMQVAGAKRQAITAKQNILLALTQERPPLYAAIAQMGVIIPEGVWLTDLAADKTGLKVLGMAKSYPEVAEFLQKVQANVLFADFTLLRTEQENALAKFEFSVKFKRM